MTITPVNPKLEESAVQQELLMVVDVQNGFINHRSQHVVAPIASFVENWLQQGRPVILTRFINPPNSQWEKLMHWTNLRSAPEIELAPPLAKIAAKAPTPATVVDKCIYSSLTPRVKELIQEINPTRILLCGIDTDACVLKTAVDIFELGRTPIVLADLCASHAGEEVHQAGLLLIRRFIGASQVVQSADPSN